MDPVEGIMVVAVSISEMAIAFVVRSFIGGHVSEK